MVRASINHLARVKMVAAATVMRLAATVAKERDVVRTVREALYCLGNVSNVTEQACSSIGKKQFRSDF